MKAICTYTLIFIGATFFATPTYPQQPDSLKKAQVKYLSKDLSLPESSAAQVVTIMDNYKENAKKVASDKKLTPEGKKVKLDNLIIEKNKQLSLLLTDKQFNKIVPTSERIKK